MKTKTIAGSLAILATLGFSGAAAASTINVGTLSMTPYIHFEVESGAFSDTYNFTIATLSDAAASVTNHTLYYGPLTILNIPDLSMSIYDAGNNLLDTVASGGSSYGLAPAGNYHAVVSGTTTGLSGGAYMISMTASPVPVPAAVWLLGSGLLGLVGVARRKNA